MRMPWMRKLAVVAAIALGVLLTSMSLIEPAGDGWAVWQLGYVPARTGSLYTPQLGSLRAVLDLPSERCRCACRSVAVDQAARE